MSLKETFGANLRQYRKAERLTQSELAERADLSLDMIGRIERGIAAPSFETVERLAGALSVPEETLFGAFPVPVPSGERGRLLRRINIRLSRMNEDTLSRAEKLLAALE